MIKLSKIIGRLKKINRSLIFEKFCLYVCSSGFIIFIIGMGITEISGKCFFISAVLFIFWYLVSFIYGIVESFKVIKDK